MKSLRKKPTFDELIYDLQRQPIIKYPARKGINILDDMMISNLLFDDKPLEEWEEIKHDKETYIDPSYLPKISIKHSKCNIDFSSSIDKCSNNCMRPCSCHSNCSLL